MRRFIMFAALLQCLSAAAEKTVSLDGEWRLSFRRQQEGGEWRTIPAEVPGEAQLALVKAGVAADPTVGTNVYSMLEYEQCEWKYERSFGGVKASAGERIELRFGGVDTRAEYFLNGERIGESANMFVPVAFDVTGRLRDENRLVVHLKSILGGPSLGLLGRNRVGGSDFEYLRKAQHSVGWDIMPRLATAGIWKSVELAVVPPVRLTEFGFATKSVDVAKRRADCVVHYRVEAPWRHLHRAKLRYTLGRGDRVVRRWERVYHFQHTRDDFSLGDVDFWWPRDAGEAALYDLRTEFVSERGEVLAVDERRVGVRTIRLERADWRSEAEPGTFRFVVNGRPVYMHGCDTTPMDAFHSRDRLHARKCLEMLVDLNCNMIRSWGGGVYEDEDFFRFCDENGICVWQDFSLGNVYPSQRDDFAAALEREAIATVTRLRAHPSLALWCGNNEIDRAMAGAWRAFAPNPDLERTSREILPRVLREFDPFTSYLPSSPVWNEEMTRVAAKDGPWSVKLSQDHLWGPREKYFRHPYWTNSVTAFVSETGVHGCPNLDSLKRMMTPAGLYPWPDRSDKTKFNAEWNCKAVTAYPDQNFNERNALMVRQVQAFFGDVPDDLADFAELSQIYQAEALKCWAGTYRCRKGRTWGMLWWNLRDGWPIVSDGIVDYYYGKKKAYAALKLVNQPQLVQLCDGQADGILAVNDRPYAVKGRVKVCDVDSGKVLFDADAELAADSVAKLMPRPALAGQGALLIEYDFEGIRRRNVCIYGEPPFAAAKVRSWLKTGCPAADAAQSMAGRLDGLRPSWSMVVEDTKTEIVPTQMKTHSRTVDRDGRIVDVWTGHPAAGDGFRVVTEWIEGDEGRLEGTIRFEGYAGTRPVAEIHFPAVSVPFERDAKFLWGGSDMGFTFSSKVFEPGKYDHTRGMNAMQFGAILRPSAESLYFDYRDCAWNIKRVRTRLSSDRVITVCGVYPVPRMDERPVAAGGIPYPSGVKLYRGGWFDAARIYRPWALKQSWAKGRFARNPLADIDLWIWNRGLAEDVIAPVERLADDLPRVKLALDWYWWHSNPYDTDYPFFWPPREGVESFTKSVKRLTDRGIYSQVYVNGMCWDIDSAHWTDDKAPGLMHRRNGEVRAYAFNKYNNHRLAWMCGEAPAHHDAMSELVGNLRRAGLTGQYLDMIGNASFDVCWNPAHRHVRNGGHAVTDGYREMLARLGRENPGRPLTTEGSTELYMDRCDGSIICNVASGERMGVDSQDIVPLFTAVYHGSYALFGNYALPDAIPPWDPKWPDADRWPAAEEKAWHEIFPDQFYLEMARPLIWGAQPMVCSLRPKHRDDPAFRSVYRFVLDTANFYHDHKDFLWAGEMTSPDGFVCAEKEVEFFARMIFTKKDKARIIRKRQPCVLHSCWKNARGEEALFLCNYTSERQQWSFRGMSGTMPPRSYAMQPILY